MSFASASAGCGSVFRSVHPLASSETIFDCLCWLRLVLGFVFLAPQRHGLRQAKTALDVIVVHSRGSGAATETALSLIHRGKIVYSEYTLPVVLASAHAQDTLRAYEMYRCEFNVCLIINGFCAPYFPRYAFSAEAELSSLANRQT